MKLFSCLSEIVYMIKPFFLMRKFFIDKRNVDKMFFYSGQVFLPVYICLLFLFACKEENPVLPRQEYVLHIEEVQTNDTNIPVTYTNDFYYSDGRLLSYIEKQTYNEETIINTYTVNWQENAVIITDGTQEICYSLGADKYAEYALLKENIKDNSVPSHERSYTFIYSDTGQLESVKEIIEGNAVECNFVFSYENGNLFSLASDHYFPMVYHYTISGYKNTGHLPWLPLTEMYPLYFHKVAFYAGILGCSLPYFPETMQVDGNQDETTYYEYETDSQARLTSFTEKIISYGSTYSRTFHYSLILN